VTTAKAYNWVSNALLVGVFASAILADHYKNHTTFVLFLGVVCLVFAFVAAALGRAAYRPSKEDAEWEEMTLVFSEDTMEIMERQRVEFGLENRAAVTGR
jgi:positive regulator of sigma E activity